MKMNKEELHIKTKEGESIDIIIKFSQPEIKDKVQTLLKEIERDTLKQE